MLNPDGSNVKLALKKKELDNLRIANTGQGRSITPSNLSVISENEKVNVGKAQPKFSLKAPVEETKDLIAVHNATEKNVRGLLRLGGLPMPSIAIIKAAQGHDDFGEYSFVFDKSTIDPTTVLTWYGTDIFLSNFF